MAMTKKELATRNQIAEYLGENGHGTYAEYLMLFDLHFMSDQAAAEGHVAYMVPNRGMIFINRDIDDIEVLDLLIRHEMLHEYLKHADRYQNVMRQKLGVKDKEEVSFSSQEEAALYHHFSNIAADLELSKFYSPDKDFFLAKNLIVGDEVVSGLVLELDHPEWLELTYEEIFEELTKTLESIKQVINDKGSSSQEKSQERGEEGEKAGDIKDKAKDMQDKAEDIEKEAQNQSKEEKGSISKEEISEIIKNAESLKRLAKELEKQAAELEKDSENRSAAFNEEDEAKERQKRLKDIEEFWEKLENKEKLVKEIEERIYDEKRAIIQKEKEKSDKEYIKNLSVSISGLEPMKNFVLDLNRTIKRQLADSGMTVDTYTRKPITNVAIRGVHRPGETKQTPKKTKPSIQVIYDRSGSWFPAAKTRAGDLALFTIKKKYVDRGLINLDVFYCSAGPVTSDRAKADKGGGGMNGAAVIEHLNRTKPDNVIILTDSDPDYFDYYETARIPGTAWFLFYDSTAPKFAAHIQARNKKYYDLRNSAGLEEIIKNI